MKQTAVEWLIDEMNNIKGSSTNMNGKVQFIEKELNNLFDQAKEIEKEQIQLAFLKGHEFVPEWKINNVPYIDAEQYYNETFKSE